MDFIRGLITRIQKKSGALHNLEATPAEGASYRLALLDKKKFLEILCANEDEYRKGAAPFYTNSTQLPANHTDYIIEEYIRRAERQIDKISRRVVFDEKIAHKEKAFSIFQPHTESISKGKAGVVQELGLGVCVHQDQFGFILHYRVMLQQTENKMAVDMVQETKDSPENRP